MDVLLLHVHGFGGKDLNEGFISHLNKFILKNCFENSIYGMTYKWDSQKISMRKLGNDWLTANEQIDNESANFIKHLKEISKDYDAVYITAFSIGAKLVCKALDSMKVFPENLHGVFLLAAAIERNFKFSHPISFRIISYISAQNDKVLKFLFSFMENEKPAGETGFSDLSIFRNLVTTCHHFIGGRSYNRVFPAYICSQIAVWEGIYNKIVYKKEINTLDRVNYHKIHRKINKIFDNEKVIVFTFSRYFQQYFVMENDDNKSIVFRSKSLLDAILFVNNHYGGTRKEYLEINDQIKSDSSSYAETVAINNILGNFLNKTLGLNESYNIFSNILGEIKNDSVVINHIAINFCDFSSGFIDTFSKYDSLPKVITYNLLILSSEINESSHQDVIRWVKDYDESIIELERVLDSLTTIFQEHKIKFNLIVKEYSKSEPGIYGWSLRNPVKLWFVSSCHFHPVINDKFDKFLDDFIVITEEVDKSEAEEFDAEFIYLWKNGKEIKLN